MFNWFENGLHITTHNQVTSPFPLAVAEVYMYICLYVKKKCGHMDLYNMKRDNKIYSQ